MQQHRQPRLGDTLDDYCPRERRITNHAVVAMVGPDIKQTRCTTCDAEHEYKHAKVPSTRKKKESPTALYKQVLASAQPEAVKAAQPAADQEPADPPISAEPPTESPEATPPPAVAAEPDPGGQSQDETVAGEDDGPVHRRLIRATLPRPEGPTQRPLPQFTVRQPGKFSNNTRGGGRPQGMGGSTSRPHTSSPSRGSFGRSSSRGDTFSARSSGPSPHGLQRSRPGHRPSGRPVRHGKKSPK